MTNVLQRLAMAGVLVGGVSVLAASTAQATRPERPGPRARAAARRGFQLFAGAPSLSLEVNRFYCGLTDAGNVCTDVTGSPVLGGGSWPRGTPDQYVFNTGIQLAGIIPANAGFAWAGDTVGAWAIDTRGPAEHMQGLTGIYNSLNSDDVANWPSAAYVRDTSLFHPSLIKPECLAGDLTECRANVSQQDTWMRYWDGAPSLVTGRSHTMGVLVEQRSLAWNFPTGNEDLIYFIFRFTNITARASSGAYAGLSSLGYTAADIAEVGALGDLFQSQSEAAFNVAIPDAGYTIDNMFVAFTADMDVGDATNNYASAALPFSLGVTWKSDWRESTWQFPPNIFTPPFASAPGFVGVKYLKSPIDPATNQEFGITIFSTYTNPSAPNSLFPDPINITQGYRYMQGTASPTFGDNNSCQYVPARRLCFLTQAPSDQRTMQSSGPFSLAPGQTSVVVVAYMAAPALLTNPGAPTYSLGPYIGNTNLLPGIVPAGDRLVTGLDTLRLIDRTMGWVSHADLNGNGVIEQPRTVIRNDVTVLSIPREISVVRGSLLDKALVAQGVFDNQFLLPFAPEAPDFYLVPSNNRVTVVWRASNTETVGDPYFAVASNPASGQLFDPNFREFDVEGYRVWRGRSPATMEMIAQFDYKTTAEHPAIRDYTGAFFNGDYNNADGANQCAPELGITASCPATFATAPPYVNYHEIPLAVLGPSFPGAVQVAAQGRVALANGTVLITVADTAVTGGGSGFPGLQDTGVPFAYEDNSVRNGYRYFYAVTAFDVNSLASGPSSLSSPLVTKSITPRSASGQETAGSLGAPQFIRADGSVVPDIPVPTIDPVTGIFSGPFPPTDMALGFAAFVPQIISGSGNLELFFDSVVPGASLNGIDGAYYLRVAGAAGTDTLEIPVSIDAFSSDFSFITAFEAAPVDPAQNARFGAGSNFSLFGSLEFTVPGVWRLTNQARGDANGDPTRSAYNGPRWWAGTPNENTPDPNLGMCYFGACGGSPVVSNPNRTAGSLPGVTAVMTLQSYNTTSSVPGRNFEAITAYTKRAADFQMYWGAGGTVDSIVDITHGVQVPFHPMIRGSWGFLTDASFAAVPAANTRDGRNNVLTWGDIYCIEPAPALIGECGGSTAPLQNTATLSPIATVGGSAASLATAAATGNGFIMYLAGHTFIMEMTALPAAGTVWNVRYYTGAVRTSSQSGGTYSYRAAERPPAVPGMHVRIAYEGTSFTPTVTSDSMMRRIHTVPDPYYVTNNSEITPNSKVLRFVNLPAQSIIRIYSVSGILVNVVTHNDPTGSGEQVWDLRNRNNQFVASGVYFYHVESPDGRTRIGRFTVVNFAQ
ncbi:MAG: hypothetical protein HYR48_00840 [Gemmatimonadetes bacterium]|nr:hypothetical protein [Gemmatimonadota bacterium]